MSFAASTDRLQGWTPRRANQPAALSYGKVMEGDCGQKAAGGHHCLGLWWPLAATGFMELFGAGDTNINSSKIGLTSSWGWSTMATKDEPCKCFRHRQRAIHISESMASMASSWHPRQGQGNCTPESWSKISARRVAAIAWAVLNWQGVLRYSQAMPSRQFEVNFLTPAYIHMAPLSTFPGLFHNLGMPSFQTKS